MNVLSRIVLVPLLALAFLALAPNEAQAIPACDRFGANNTICFYNFNDFGGGELSIDADAFVGPNWNNMSIFGSSYDNWMNSWINNSGHDGRWATGLNGNGSIFCLNANGQNNSVGSPNTMSSFRIFSGSTVC